MKISFYSQNYSNNYKSQYRSSKSSKPHLTSDVFVKKLPQQNISFTGLTTLAQKFEPLQKDILASFQEHSVLKQEEALRIIRKYAPFLKIGNFAEYVGNGNVHNRTAAYFQDEISFSRNGDVRNGEKALFLRDVNENNYQKNAEYAQSLIHEMTHYFQENSSDRVSKFEWIKNFLKNGKPAEINAYLLEFFTKFFATVEYNLNYPIIRGLGKKNEIPIPVNEVSENVVNSIYKNLVKADVENFMYYIINQVAKNSNFPNYRDDQKKAFEYLVLLSQKEYEAYNNQVQFAKKLYNVEGATDMDLIVKLYEMFHNVSAKIERNF